MSSWNGKTKGNVLGYKIFVFTIKLFGLKGAYILLAFVSFYFVLFSRKAFNSSYNFYRIRFGYSPVKSFFKTWKNNYIFGQTLIDKTILFSGRKHKFTFHFDGEENLKKIAADNLGGILISAHIGNWDIAGNFLHSRVTSKINIVIFDAEHQQIKEYFDTVHKEKQMNIIPIREDASHIFKINKALSDRELICIHGDRFVSGSKTVSKKFLGEEALFPVGPFAIASKYDLPVVFVFAVKESKYHYHLFCSKPKSYKNDLEGIMNDYLVRLEEMTKAYPEQWFNFYDFWKK